MRSAQAQTQLASMLHPGCIAWPVLEWKQLVQLQTLGLVEAISACGSSASHLVLHLLDDMDAKRLRRDVIGSSAAMSSLSQASLWEQSLGVLNSMALTKIESNSIAFNACSSEHHHWQRAVLCLKNMEEARVPVTDVSISTAIAACERSMEHDVGLALLWHSEDAAHAVCRCRSCSNMQQSHLIDRMLGSHSRSSLFWGPSAGSW